jgi:hypothetical protein
MSAIVPLTASVPHHLEHRLIWLSDRARNMGIHLMAGKGSGKSRLMGRVITWLDFLRGIPLVILDPVGPTIDNFLDKIARLPEAEQRRLWKRVVYVDMSGQGERVLGWPLYYRLGDESLYAVAQRYLDVVRRVDPSLQSASVEGFNALWRIGTYAGMVLSALGCQITEAESLLTNVAEWSARFAEAERRYPEVAPAVRFFTEEYASWKEDKQASRSDSFRTKIALFTLDPTMRAMFGSAAPGIDWRAIVENRQAVLLDFRHEHDVERRRFKMLWAYSSFMEFVKHRGAGRHRPVSLVIDELAALANFRASDGISLLADELEELINVYARNCMVWLTIAHQELYQFDERVQKTLMTMGTHIFGSTSDIEAAITVARQLYSYDPHKVKRYEPLYMQSPFGPEIIHERPVEFTIDEQFLMKGEELRTQRAFHFLVRPAPGEGNTTGRVVPMTIENFDRNSWVDDALVAQARTLLRARIGVPKVELLSSIEARLHNPTGIGISTMNQYGQAPHRFPVSEDDDEETTLRELKAPAPEAGRF